MKKSNEEVNQMVSILNEEIARACMIMEAQKILSDNDFSIFLNELRDYEQNLVITESNQGQMLYEGFFDRLKNVASGAISKIAPDNTAKLEKLADDLGMVDAEIEVATKMGNKSEVIALKAKARSLVQDMAKIDPTAAQEAAKLYDAPGSIEQPQGGGGAEGGGMNQQQKQKAVDDLFAKADAATTTARADSALGQIKNAFVGSFVKSTQANEEMWGAAKRFFSGLFQPKKPQNEDDILLKILAQLQGIQGLGQAMPSPEEVKDEIEDIPDGAPEEGAEEEADESGLNKDTPMSIMTRQKDVKPGKGGEKETPLVMSIQKMGLSQPTAQQIAKRIGQYLKQRKIAIAESVNRMNESQADKIIDSLLTMAPKRLLFTLFEGIDPEDVEQLIKIRKMKGGGKDSKEGKKLYRKMLKKYHPDQRKDPDVSKEEATHDFQEMNKLASEYQYNEPEPFKGKGKSEEEKGTAITPSAEDIEKDIKSKPDKAAIVFVKDLKKAGVKVDDETSTALATQFDKIKRDRVPREKISTALALVVSNAESGETSPRDVKIQVAGIANLDPDKDITKQTPPEKVIRNAYKAERARIRAMSKGKGVIHKIISRFISDNQQLMKKDPALSDIFKDQPKFNQFAKKVRNNIKRMLQRRGYEDAEIGKLLERMNIEEEMKNAANKVLLEYRK